MPLLLPENVRIDTRDVPGFLSYAYHAARWIQFYNRDNEPAGNWTRFLEKDPSVLLALVLDNRSAYWEDLVRDSFRQFYTSEGESRAVACKEIIVTLLEMGLLLNAWYQKSHGLLLLKTDLPLTRVLDQAILPNENNPDSLSDKLKQLYGLIITLKSDDVLEIEQSIIRGFALFDPVWGVDKPPVPAVFTGEKEAQKLDEVAEIARDIYLRLMFTMRFIEEKAPEWFRQSIENTSNHDPQNGLLLAFLQLLTHVRDQLNEKPQEHLRYYYGDVLEQQFVPFVPDRTMVGLELADHVNEYLLERHTALSAGTNENGVESIYRTVEDLLITKTRIAALKTVFVAKNNMMKGRSSYKLISGIYAAPVANSKDGMGAPFTSGDRSWPILGAEQWDLPPDARNMTDANIGFVIASPVFFMQEGERVITLSYQFTPTSMARFSDFIEDIRLNTGEDKRKIIHDLFNNALLADVTTPDGWFRISRMQTEVGDTNEISLSLFLSEVDPPVVGNNPELPGQAFDSKHPLLRILLNPDAQYYLYSFIIPLELETVRISVQVKNMRALTLRSNAGLLDASVPFMPFGPVPIRNSYLLVGNAELFRKRLTSATIRIHWNNLPEDEGGFKSYYEAYGNNVDNRSFKVKVSALSNGQFFPLEPERQESFHLFDAKAPDSRLEPQTAIELRNLALMSIRPDYDLTSLPEYSVNARIGYFKMQLYDPAGAFGHAEYPRLFTQYMLAQTKSDGLLSGSKNKADVPMPREPFAPVIHRITVDYKAETLLNMKPMESEDNDPAADEKVFSIHPFGTQLIFSEGTARENKFIPQLDADGYLYIGLENVAPDKPINLFFSLRESKTGSLVARPQLEWSFLRGDTWQLFTEDEIMYDATRNFTTTGIVKLQIPEEVVFRHTLLPADLFWIRVAAGGNLNAIGAALDVQINAVEAVWEYNGDNRHFDPRFVLPPVQGLYRQKTEIAGFRQLTGFYGARGMDQWKPYYVRTSERLRHKSRGISTWDIERLILEAFPEVSLVKCVTWMEYDGIQPGSVNVVVTPPPSDGQLEPKMGFHQLDRIHDFLKQKMSPFVKVRVMNPIYEKVKISCSILLEKGLEHEKGKYSQLLSEALLHFICPWLKKGAIHFGGSLSKNDVVVFIKNLPYVRFVTQFSMVHVYQVDDDNNLSDTAYRPSSGEFIQASKPWSVLTPVSQHLIQFIDKEEYMAPEITAIDKMRMGTDFIILDETETNTTGLRLYTDGEEQAEWYLFPESE